MSATVAAERTTLCSRLDSPHGLFGNVAVLVFVIVQCLDGALTYLGRADDMMNAGGVRVSPIEVEDVLNAHPAIVESAAAEVRVKADTTVIAAFYVSNASVETTDLERFIAGRLARYKCPRIYARVEAIPKGANNKLLRQVLRKSYEETLSEA